MAGTITDINSLINDMDRLVSNLADDVSILQTKPNKHNTTAVEAKLAVARTLQSAKSQLNALRESEERWDASVLEEGIASKA